MEVVLPGQGGGLMHMCRSSIVTYFQRLKKALQEYPIGVNLNDSLWTECQSLDVVSSSDMQPHRVPQVMKRYLLTVLRTSPRPMKDLTHTPYRRPRSERRWHYKGAVIRSRSSVRCIPENPSGHTRSNHRPRIARYTWPQICALLRDTVTRRSAQKTSS